MLDGSEYFECICGSADHTIRFVLDKDDDMPTIYIDVFLPDWQWYKRVWLGLKYIIFGAGKSGQWQSWEIHPDDATRMKGLLTQLEECKEKGE